MAAAFKLGAQESVHDLSRKTGADDALAHGQHIGIVVQTGVFSGIGIRADSAADARHLIGRQRNADARATDDDAVAVLALCDSFGHLLAVNGVIHALRAVAAQILEGNALFFEMFLDGQLQAIARVVTSDCDHDLRTSKVISLYYKPYCALTQTIQAWKIHTSAFFDRAQPLGS